MEGEIINTSGDKLLYSIRKKDVFISAIKQFYEKKIQIFVGPTLILFGIILRQLTNVKFMGAILVAFGAFYMIFPYAILLANVLNVKNQEILMELTEGFLQISDLLTKNISTIKIDYKNIYSIDKEQFYVRITPQDESGAFLNSILVPTNKIKEGNLEAFTDQLQCRIENVGGGEKEAERKITKGKMILSYNLKMDSFKDIYIKEYYSKKIHIAYIIVFAVIAIIGISINITMAISFVFLCILYAMYPWLGYKLKSKGMIGEVCIRDCKDGYLSIVGDSIKVKVKPHSIKIIEDNERYIKYLVPIKKKYFRYIYKSDTNQEQIKKFLKILPKESYEYMKKNK